MTIDLENLQNPQYGRMTKDHSEFVFFININTYQHEKDKQFQELIRKNTELKERIKYLEKHYNGRH